MRAKDVMTTNVVTVQPNTPVKEIARTLLKRRISAVPVVDGDKVVGIVSEGDLMRRAETGTERHPSWWLSVILAPEDKVVAYVKSHGQLAKDVMSTGVVTVDEKTTLEEIAGLLEKHRIKRVPVVRIGRLVGIVSRANLLHGLVAAKVGRTAKASDETIRAQILNGLREHASVHSEFINVTVSNGVVHIWGAVDSEAERKAVGVVVENTPGVRSIDDHVGVFSSQIRSVMWAE